jgi:L-fucose isomerase-like protein
MKRPNMNKATKEKDTMRNNVGFVCFGEVNTPYERLQLKHDGALLALDAINAEIIDAGIVIDDPAYKTADTAIARLKGQDMSSLILCVAGWIPTHAAIRVADEFRHVPMVLWGLCGWREGGRIITTAEQAGTTALRPAMEAMGYTFKYIYNIIDEPQPIGEIDTYIRAAYAVRKLRSARVGTMGYRDMLLYGTQFEGNSMRAQIGVEVEPFEMLEIVRAAECVDENKVAEQIGWIKANWKILKHCDDSVIEKGVRYALAIAGRAASRGYDALTLIDVDGMKKLLGFPPAIVFMLLERICGVCTTPENDVMGNVSQLMVRYLTGQAAHYMEYYEFFKDSMLIGVPDYVPVPAVDGDVELLPTAFGLLDASLLNVSKVKKGYVTCTRLYYLKGRYYMHLYTGEARRPPKWEEYGWAPPAPQLPSLEVFPDSCTVPEFARKVSSQHVIVCYGDESRAIEELCGLLGIEIVR